MEMFAFLNQPDINQGVLNYRDADGGILLDVRTSAEYAQAHIPESKNVPLQQLDKITSVADNKDVPLYVYCHSGARSRQAVSILRRMGYTNVQNIGGISLYHGKVETI